jgi:SAM-dependent methyltransferase
MISEDREQIQIEDVIECPLCHAKEQKHIFDDYCGNPYAKCLACGLVFQNPRKVTVYEDGYWEKPMFDPEGKIRYPKNEKEYMIKNLYQHVLNYTENLKGGTVLDAGCGYGFFLLALGNKWVKYGIERSASLVNYIRQNHREINVFQGNLEDNVFNPDSFDLIFSSDTIEHISNPHPVIRQFYRVLKPNGTLIITTPNIESFCARRFKGNYRLLGASHVIMFSPSTLTRVLEDNGFKVFRKEYPYFKTDFFTLGNILRLFDTNKISPPFYGNLMTFYAKKF